MPTTSPELEQSQRFRPPETRRDFLGLAAAWSAVVAMVMALLGAMRLPMPSVFPESNSKVKLGKPKRYAVGSATYFPKHRLWLFRTPEGFHALSAVCTHLGCVTEREEDGHFQCPCHGSKFAADGALLAGPAPRGLHWVELSVSPEGWLVADTLRDVEPGTVLQA
ncbi:MAG: ubiquinol-cytochrome c reductase iron-sulfur subunit [Planctomycetota bacterium]|nr:MAG: ubiquinol-cytochrome c reductase iron-sulfur subunit [Planctomycetota bacterium]